MPLMDDNAAQQTLRELNQIQRGDARRAFLLAVRGREAGLWIRRKKATPAEARQMRRDKGCDAAIVGQISMGEAGLVFTSGQAGRLLPRWARLKKALLLALPRLRSLGLPDAILRRVDDDGDVEMAPSAPAAEPMDVDGSDAPPDTPFGRWVDDFTVIQAHGLLDAEVGADLADELIGMIQSSGEPRQALRSVGSRGLLGPLLANLPPDSQASFLVATQELLSPIREGADVDGWVKDAPNAGRARDAHARIQSLVDAAPPERRWRLASPVVGALVGAVASRATADPNGQRGILGVYQATRAATALLEMSEEDYAAAVGLLAQTGSGGAGSAAEEAVLLKAIALHHAAVQAGKADAETGAVGALADAIRGQDPQQIAAMTSCVKMAGLAGARQRFTHSCAPTTAILALAEVSPIFALKMRTQQDVFDISDPHDPMAALQRQALDALNPTGQAVSRARAAPDEATLIAAQGVDPWDLYDALDLPSRVEHSALTADDIKLLDAGLRTIAQSDPDAAQRLFEDVRAYMARPAAGLSTEGVGTMLASAVAGPLGAEVVERTVSTPADLDGLLDNMATVAGWGLPTPIGVRLAGGGGHAMMLADVRADGGGRSFLIADPWSGEAGWVTEAALRKGDLRALSIDTPGTLVAAWLLKPAQ